MRKKKIETKVNETIDFKKIETKVNETTDSTNVEVAKLLVYSEFLPEILPLELNIDFGRQDLNDVVGKLQDKINELVRKVK